MCASVKKLQGRSRRSSESIRKKHRALKTDRIEEDIALDRYFKPIIKPLQQIVDSPVRAIKRQSRDDDVASKREKKREGGGGGGRRESERDV